MKLSPTSFAAGAVAALVIGSGTAYAATGGTFILGKANAAGATTTLTNPNGTALYLKSKAGTPSLRVNTSAKVPYLNSDKLDGLDQSTFARASMKAGSFDYFADAYDDDGNGSLEAFWATAECPLGTIRTGGGAVDFTDSGRVIVNAPDINNTWTVGVIVDPAVDTNPQEVLASITCVNPKGSVSGTGVYRAAPQTLHERATAH